MTPATAARRYARALFDVVLQQNGDLDRIGRERMGRDRPGGYAQPRIGFTTSPATSVSR